VLVPAVVAGLVVQASWGGWGGDADASVLPLHTLSEVADTALSLLPMTHTAGVSNAAPTHQPWARHQPTGASLIESFNHEMVSKALEV
jgi:hypothetical protein